MFRVVVIDDEEDIRYLVKKLIEDGDQECKIVGEAEDGDLALRLCAKLKPDIIVTDIRMPGMDGLKMLAVIKKTLPSSEVILLSGYGHFEYAQQAVEHGAHAYLLKPVEEKELYQALNKAKEKIRRQKERQKNIKRLQTEIAKLQQNRENDTVLGFAECEIKHRQIQLALQFINENFCADVSLETVADHVFMNPAYFSVLFKKSVGKSFTEYINGLRMEKARQLLEVERLKISEISDLTGFTDSNYFIRIFKKYFGLTPSEYRNFHMNL